MPAPRARQFSPARRWLAVLFSILILSAPPLVGSAEEIIYAWTDEEGVRHFSARPPADGDYEIVRTLTGTSDDDRERTPDTDPADPADPAEPPETALATVAEPDPEMLRERCEQARANLDLLNQDHPAQLRDEDGEATPLDDEQRQQLVEETEAFIEEWC